MIYIASENSVIYIPSENVVIYIASENAVMYIASENAVVFVLKQKHELMKHVSHQCIVMQFILELAKSLKTDPRSCVGAFFSR